jgi:Sigma-70, region 4
MSALRATLSASAGLRVVCSLLDDVLAQLPLELRAVLVLFELEGLELKQIAALEDIPVGTASSRLRRAREDFSSPGVYACQLGASYGGGAWVLQGLFGRKRRR